MWKRISGLVFLTLAFVAGYGYGRWYGRVASVSAKSAAQPLYYRCPMHPSYRSDQPGTSPCCNMALEAVYAEDTPPKSGAIRVTPGQEQLIGIEYGIVEYAPVSRIVRAVGRVSVDENRLARIQSKLEGFIDHVYVGGPGEHVRQGQRLFSIFNRRTYSMAQMQFLQAAMDSSGMTLPATDPARPNDRRLAAAEALRAARQQLEMMGFTDDQIDAVARAQQPLYSVPVHSPINGVILELNAAVNQKLGMEPLLVIADLSKVWVTANFTGGAAGIRSGQAAVFVSSSLPQQTFPGTVQAVLPELDPATTSTRVRIEFDNAAGLLKPEMFGEVELRFPGLKKLTVPGQAVLDQGRKQSVFVDMGAGYVAPREVTTGERIGDRVEIIEGLKAGQRIVTSGNFLLDSESHMRGN